MAEETPTTTDLDLTPLLAAVIELLKTGTRPDVLEAQRVLLQRMAFQGDLFPSRVPPPRNITEVGGYLNLLETARQTEVRTQALAAALGIAAPPPGVLQPGPAIGFVDLVNDRPAGPAQPSIPATVPIRADFFTPLLTALAHIHAAGGALPRRAPARTLPATLPSDGTLPLVERCGCSGACSRPRRSRRWFTPPTTRWPSPGSSAGEQPVPARGPGGSMAAPSCPRRTGWPSRHRKGPRPPSPVGAALPAAGRHPRRSRLDPPPTSRPALVAAQPGHARPVPQRHRSAGERNRPGRRAQPPPRAG